jgi:hypothetical protein
MQFIVIKFFIKVLQNIYLQSFTIYFWLIKSSSDFFTKMYLNYFHNCFNIFDNQHLDLTKFELIYQCN